VCDANYNVTLAAPVCVCYICRELNSDSVDQVDNVHESGVRQGWTIGVWFRCGLDNHGSTSARGDSRRHNAKASFVAHSIRFRGVKQPERGAVAFTNRQGQDLSGASPLFPV
jgi:hypothetical protein